MRLWLRLYACCCISTRCHNGNYNNTRANLRGNGKCGSHCRYNAGMISALHIARHRAGPALAVEVEVVAETGSTNADLLARIPTLAAPRLLVAEAQTHGRGRARAARGCRRRERR